MIGSYCGMLGIVPLVISQPLLDDELASDSVGFPMVTSSRASGPFG